MKLHKVLKNSWTLKIDSDTLKMSENPDFDNFFKSGPISAMTQCQDNVPDQTGPFSMRVMKKSKPRMDRMVQEGETFEPEILNDENLGLRLMKKLGMRVMKKDNIQEPEDDSLGIRLMKKPALNRSPKNLGMRLMKKENENLGLRILKREDPEHFGIRILKKEDPDNLGLRILKRSDDSEDMGLRVMKKSVDHNELGMNINQHMMSYKNKK